jgi:hypothetical protein
MDQNFEYSYSGMKHVTGGFPPQPPVNEQPQEQAIDEAEGHQREPDTDWTVYSMDVGRQDSLYMSKLNETKKCFGSFQWRLTWFILRHLFPSSRNTDLMFCSGYSWNSRWE